MGDIFEALLAAWQAMGHDPTDPGVSAMMTEIAYFADGASDREVADRLDLLARLVSDVSEVFRAKAATA